MLLFDAQMSPLAIFRFVDVTIEEAPFLPDSTKNVCFSSGVIAMNRARRAFLSLRLMMLAQCRNAICDDVFGRMPADEFYYDVQYRRATNPRISFL